MPKLKFTVTCRFSAQETFVIIINHDYHQHSCVVLDFCGNMTFRHFYDFFQDSLNKKFKRTAIILK